jgi:glycosyltransferase involved in cell wall biosynthesis
VQLQPVAAPLVNEYLLSDPATARALVVRPGRHWATTIGRSMARRRHRGPADIVHNTFYLPRALADYPQAMRVVTVHDMIPELFPDTRRRLDFLTVKKRYVEKADHIVCVSESTKSDLLRLYGEVSAPISVVYSGVGPEFVPEAPPLPKWPGGYVLYVGNRSSYKDADTLLQAFARIAGAHPGLMLMLVGGGPLTSQEQARIRTLGIGDRVFQQRVPDSQMPSAYANARLFVFPSEYEGFGLPAVEAMACGTPMILCDSSSLPEVGADAAVYFPRRDVNALTAAMDELLHDDARRQALSKAGIDRAAEFTWERTARDMADVYRRTMESDRRVR